MDQTHLPDPVHDELSSLEVKNLDLIQRIEELELKVRTLEDAKE